jgi:hypothetical protein
MIVPALIMILAERDDPDNPLVFAEKPDVRADLYGVAAAFRTAFRRTKQPGSAFPVTKPGPMSDPTLTFTF